MKFARTVPDGHESEKVAHIFVMYRLALAPWAPRCDKNKRGRDVGCPRGNPTRVVHLVAQGASASASNVDCLVERPVGRPIKFTKVHSERSEPQSGRGVRLLRERSEPH